MRPVILCTSFLVGIFSVNVQAQTLTEEQPANHKHEFSVGYGILGTPAVSSVIGDVFTFFVFSQDTERQFRGPAILGYNYKLSPKVSLGVTASYTNLKSTYISSGEPATNINYIAVLPRFSYYWASDDIVEVYSGIGLGACYLDSSFDYGDNSRKEVELVSQLTALGVRAGRKTGFFMEMGLGMNGLLNAGFDRRF